MGHFSPVVDKWNYEKVMEMEEFKLWIDKYNKEPVFDTLANRRGEIVEPKKERPMSKISHNLSPSHYPKERVLSDDTLLNSFLFYKHYLESDKVGPHDSLKVAIHSIDKTP